MEKESAYQDSASHVQSPGYTARCMTNAFTGNAVTLMYATFEPSGDWFRRLLRHLTQHLRSVSFLNLTERWK
jgi:hypothetical protein